MGRTIFNRAEFKEVLAMAEREARAPRAFGESVFHQILKGSPAVERLVQHFDRDEAVAPLLDDGPTHYDSRFADHQRWVRQEILGTFRIPEEQLSPSPRPAPYYTYEAPPRGLYNEDREETEPQDELDRRFISGRQQMEDAQDALAYAMFRTHDEGPPRRDPPRRLTPAIRAAPARETREVSEGPRFQPGRVIDMG